MAPTDCPLADRFFDVGATTFTFHQHAVVIGSIIQFGTNTVMNNKLGILALGQPSVVKLMAHAAWSLQMMAKLLELASSWCMVDVISIPISISIPLSTSKSISIYPYVYIYIYTHTRHTVVHSVTNQRS